MTCSSSTPRLSFEDDKRLSLDRSELPTGLGSGTSSLCRLSDCSLLKLLALNDRLERTLLRPFTDEAVMPEVAEDDADEPGLAELPVGLRKPTEERAGKAKSRL